MTQKSSIPDLGRELSRSLSEMRIYLRQYLQSKIKEHGLDITFELLEIVLFLYRKDGANQQEIADVLSKDKSSMTYLIDNLVKRDMVKRVEDENDRRNKRIFLTEKSLLLKDDMTPWITAIYEKATNGVKAAELEKAIAVVRAMNDNLKG
jgi:DNA-binding MarR family transcriptional regulator